jgi:hypothetical protein
MIFNSSNLIDTATLARSVRTLLQQMVPSANPPHDQIVAALNLACADLDAADPLTVVRTIDTTAYKGQTDPVINVTTRHYGPGAYSLYDGDTLESNQVGFSLVDSMRAQLHATLSNVTLSVLIRWPRQPRTIPYSDRPAGYAFFTDCKCVLSNSTVDPYRLFDTDGVSLAVGNRALACLGKDSAAIGNGIYTVNVANLTRSTDCDAVSEVPVGKCCKVTAGDLYQDTVWQIVDPVCIGIGTSPINFSQLTYPTNIDAGQAAAHITPRAAAYVALQLAVSLDKTKAATVTAWATALLARPIVTPRDAISHRLQTGTLYATD